MYSLAALLGSVSLSSISNPGLRFAIKKFRRAANAVTREEKFFGYGFASNQLYEREKYWRDRVVKLCEHEQTMLF